MTNPVQATTSLVFTQPAPVSEDIKSVAATLGGLAGDVDEHNWLIVRLAIKNLLASAEQVEMYERRFYAEAKGL